MRIGRAIPGADALLFRHTIPSRLGLIIAERNPCEIALSEGMESNGVKHPTHEFAYSTDAISCELFA
ncbi:hypothetical protein CKF42_20930 [Pantoea sp. ARC270]|nr:hypothetical protein CKF42_20930 [Pantoea sp. ARC270]